MNITEIETLHKEIESIITHLQNGEKEQAINKLGYMSDNLIYDIKDMRNLNKNNEIEEFISNKADSGEKDEMFRK